MGQVEGGTAAGDGMSEIDNMMDGVVASWRKVWRDDCKQKCRIVPFGKWCMMPLVEDDPDSSPFEIANVYECERT